MSFYNNHSFLAAVRGGLQSSVKDGRDLDRLCREIKKTLAFLNWKPPPESEFYDFASKLTRVVDHFASEGLTREDYVRASVKKPQILVQNPDTIIGNVDGVVSHFTNDGMSRQNYLQAAIRFTTLFCISSNTIIENVEGVISHFAAEGLSRRDYVLALLKQPSLFSDSAESVIRHIDGVATHFASDGLTSRAYLQAALRRPSLFSQSDQTVIRHVNLLTELYDRKLLDLPKSRSEADTNLSPVLRILLANPQMFAYSDKAIILRELHSVIFQTPLSRRQLRVPLNQINNQLISALNNGDLSTAVTKVGLDASQDSYSRNLLLRALIREGFSRGQIS